MRPYAGAQSRTAPEALVDEAPIVSLWDQFGDLGEYEPHVIDTSDHQPAETHRAVADAFASDSFLLSTASARVT